MSHNSRMFRVVTGLILLFLIALCAGCNLNADTKDEIPITTKSQEARELFLQARQLAEKYRNDEARELFAQAIAKDPDFALAHLYYAGLSMGSAIDRQNHLQRAVELAPKVSEGERLLIEAYQADEDRNFVRAGELYEQLTQKYPNDKRAHDATGSFHYFNGEYDKAITAYEIAIEIDKDFGPSYNMLGYAHRDLGHYDKAEAAFKNYIRLIPDEANPHDSIADLYTKMGRYEDAIRHYEKAVELDPKFIMSQLKIGENLVLMGKYDEGRETMRKTKEMADRPVDKVLATSRTARSYLYEGNYEEAMAGYEEYTKMAAQHNLPQWEMWSYQTRAFVCTELGDLNKAEQIMAEGKRAILASELRDSRKVRYENSVLGDEALIAAKRMDFEAAMAKADEYKAKIEAGNDPKQIERYHALIGQIYFEKGEYDSAIKHLMKANQERPYNLYVLAVSESKLGNQEKANELYKKVADWNEYDVGHALVRSKAIAALHQDVTHK